MAWSLRLEFESDAQLSECFRDCVGVLKDAGTERSIPRIMPISTTKMLADLFDPPEAQAAAASSSAVPISHDAGNGVSVAGNDHTWPEELAVDAVVDEDQRHSESEWPDLDLKDEGSNRCAECQCDEAGGGGEEPTVDLSRSISIDGPSHMIHNCTEDLNLALETYKKTVSQMKHVCRMMRRPHS